MKTLTLTASVLAAAFLFATPVQAAGPWDFNPDLYGDIVSDLNAPGYVGTSLPDTRKRLHVDQVVAGFPNPDIDETGYVIGTAGPERGYGDEYGSIMFDLGLR
ncbi:MAG: hypothetical protein B7Y26_13220 [Hydrogenophilales bacterium 16-64-46]|nr:MAG: hypothetical protein B7Z32_12770 [Hydrogenophilales bacterium 12-64-13]OYZ04088.1 MAG: hypothetical protein B7Y26_13220 [Hydrogenophilales bacterium 16-64-46]OZA36837.1 MAG: hypothetical protein B7X87_12775 [Hydrogenophilales bacterium 17-64-34]HQT00051.1 hypothetical protein [Thiobacillus sp.]